MFLKNGFVINPEEFFRPSIRISPFNTSYIKSNKNIAEKFLLFERKSLNAYFGDNYIATSSGKEAILLALSNYNLQKHDDVLIVTTTGNNYISSCVTKTIEQVCSWTRTLTNETKVIFVNHEFGYPFTNWKQIESYKLPIIEDRAYSLFSSDNETTGKKGDFVIYSLPKWFPMQMGGILQANIDTHLTSRLPQETQQLLLNMLKYYLDKSIQLIEQRNYNYKYLKELFLDINCPPFFKEDGNFVPGVFMFSNDAEMNLPKLKEFMQNNGVESSVFYGENAFYLPVHQNLSKEHIDFIFTLVKFFKNQSI